jgi:hypothetical protein
MSTECKPGVLKVIGRVSAVITGQNAGLSLIMFTDGVNLTVRGQVFMMIGVIYSLYLTMASQPRFRFSNLADVVDVLKNGYLSLLHAELSSGEQRDNIYTTQFAVVEYPYPDDIVEMRWLRYGIQWPVEQ